MVTRDSPQPVPSQVWTLTAPAPTKADLDHARLRAAVSVLVAVVVVTVAVVAFVWVVNATTYGSYPWLDGLAYVEAPLGVLLVGSTVSLAVRDVRRLRRLTRVPRTTSQPLHRRAKRMFLASAGLFIGGILAFALMGLAMTFVRAGTLAGTFVSLLGIAGIVAVFFAPALALIALMWWSTAVRVEPDPLVPAAPSPELPVAFAPPGVPAPVHPVVARTTVATPAPPSWEARRARRARTRSRLGRVAWWALGVTLVSWVLMVPLGLLLEHDGAAQGTQVTPLDWVTTFDVLVAGIAPLVALGALVAWLLARRPVRPRTIRTDAPAAAPGDASAREPSRPSSYRVPVVDDDRTALEQAFHGAPPRIAQADGPKFPVTAAQGDLVLPFDLAESCNRARSALSAMALVGDWDTSAGHVLRAETVVHGPLMLSMAVVTVWLSSRPEDRGTVATVRVCCRTALFSRSMPCVKVEAVVAALREGRVAPADPRSAAAPVDARH